MTARAGIVLKLAFRGDFSPCKPSRGMPNAISRRRTRTRASVRRNRCRSRTRPRAYDRSSRTSRTEFPSGSRRRSRPRTASSSPSRPHHNRRPCGSCPDGTHSRHPRPRNGTGTRPRRRSLCRPCTRRSCTSPVRARRWCSARSCLACTLHPSCTSRERGRFRRVGRSDMPAVRRGEPRARESPGRRCRHHSLSTSTCLHIRSRSRSSRDRSPSKQARGSSSAHRTSGLSVAAHQAYARTRPR